MEKSLPAMRETPVRSERLSTICVCVEKIAYFKAKTNNLHENKLNDFVWFTLKIENLKVMSDGLWVQRK